jgi:DNA (cytosine-5)-methyltransferase 1
MRHGSLFSGIGGFDLAAEWMGWENVFHCEWNEFGQKVLKHYWPKAESFTDITKSDFTKYNGTIDIISGGFPCQPYSQAGKRKGKEDERHLWPEMLRAIREVQPAWIVGENVSGLVNWNGGLVFDEVQADLETEGYEVTPFLLPACGKDAPHRRERIWFIAYANGRRCAGEKHRQTETERNTENGKKRIITNSGSQQLQEWAQDNFTTNRKEDRTGLDDRIERSIHIGAIADALLQNQQRNRLCEKSQEMPLGRCYSSKIGFDQFPTQSPICSRNDGLSSELAGITFSKHRKESIKAYGNAIVPQVAYEIFKAIEATNQLIKI